MDYENEQTANVTSFDVKSKEITHSKLTEFQWDQIEIIDHNAIQIINSLKEHLVDGLKNTRSKNDLKSYNTEKYDVYSENIRKIIAKHLGFDVSENNSELNKQEKNKGKKQKVKKQKVHINKADQIKMSNTLQIITKKTNELFDLFTKSSMMARYDNGFKSDYVEFKIMTIMFKIHDLINKIPNKRDGVKQYDSHIEEMYEAVIGFLKSYDDIISVQNISKQAVEDLDFFIKKLIRKCNFNIATLIRKYQKLITITKYDNLVRSKIIIPYQTQIDTIQVIKEALESNNNQSLMLYLRSAIGSGKTTIATIICMLLLKLQREQVIKKKTELIFCCTVSPVRNNVANTAYNAGVPFGVATSKQGEIHISNNYHTCPNERDRVLIVSDAATTKLLLDKKKNDVEYILFIDEPNVDADQKNSTVTLAITNLVTCAPRITILSSATLPEEKDIPTVRKTFENLHSNVKFHTVKSSESKIGCTLYSQDGSFYSPYSGCKTIEQLKQVIYTMKTNGFLSRMFTPIIVYKLYNKLIKNGYELNDIEEHFLEMKNLSQRGFELFGIYLLEEILKKNSDHEVEKICCNEIDELDVHEIKISPNLLTTDAHKVSGGCLIVTETPLKTFHEICEDYCKLVNIKQILTQYNKAYNAWKLELDKLEDHLVVSNSSVKMNGQYAKVEESTSIRSNAHEYSEKIQALEQKSPKLEIPDWFKINSFSHIKKFNDDYIELPTYISPSTGIDPTHIPTDFSIDDCVQYALYGGIIILSDEIQDTRYTEYALSLLGRGAAQIIVSDVRSICYGTNNPIHNIVVHENVSKNHSMSTFYQLFGRVGRPGVSWTGHAYVPSDVIQRLKDNVNGTVDDSIIYEASNIEAAFMMLDDMKKKEIEKVLLQSTDIQLDNDYEPKVIINNPNPKLVINTKNVESVQKYEQRTQPRSVDTSTSSSNNRSFTSTTKYIPPSYRRTNENGNVYDSRNSQNYSPSGYKKNDNNRW
jgi:hypothetical protein